MKTVLITGGTRGIGKATAIAFARHGYQLALTYLENLEAAEQTKEQLEKEYSVPVLLLRKDLASEEEIKEIVEETIRTFGRIDCLINNAGIAIDTLVEDKTKENFLKTLDVNLVGPFLLARLVGDKMKEQKEGVIVNVASTNGIDTNYPEGLDYDASKAGLISLTHNLATYYAKEVRVNAVAPGWVDTDAVSDLEHAFQEKEEEKILLGRFARPEEIGKVIYFLASEDASYINDTVLRIDGGVKR